MSDGLLAEYRWLANGTKAGVADNSGAGYEYLGSLVYKRVNGELQLESASFSGGRITLSEGTDGSIYTPNYFLADHLGSTRVIAKPVDSGIEIAERNDYYAFGGKHENPNLVVSDNRFRFSGKEDQTTGDLPYQDFGARFFGKKLPVWTSIDPLAEKYYSISPYVFCANNPILFIDPDGKQVIKPIGTWGFTQRVGKYVEEKGPKAVILEALTYTDVNDVVVLGSSMLSFIPGVEPINVDGTPATADDIYAAEVGLFIPVASGSAVKNVGKTADKAVDGIKAFGKGESTTSITRKEAFGKAKEANGIPRSQQPDKTIKPNTPEGNAAGLDSRNVKQMEFTNSKGEKITIRQDQPANYPNGQPQGPHYNAGPASDPKLKQHHYYNNLP